MKLFKSFILSGLLIFIASCKSEPAPPYEFEKNPVYSDMGLVYYGAYYENYGIPNHVFSLQFITEGVFNETGDTIIAPGQYLSIDDLFISEERIDNWLEENPRNALSIADFLDMLEGEYNAADSGEPYTFFPGQTYTVGNSLYYLGTWIYYIISTSSSERKLIISGSFSIKKEGIKFNFITDDEENLYGSYGFNSEETLQLHYSPGVKKQLYKIN